MRSRREVIGSGVALALAAVCQQGVRRGWALRQGAQADGLDVVAIAKHRDGYAGLVRGHDGSTELLSLLAEPDGGLQAADRLGPSLPTDVHPVAIAAGTDGFVVGGGRTVVVGDVPTLSDSSRSGLDHLDPAYEANETTVSVQSLKAALFVVTGEAIDELALPSELDGSSFSVVEAMGHSGDGKVRALVAHNASDEEIRYAANLSVLTIQDRAVTEAGGARDLGESGPNHLVCNPGRPVEVLLNRSDASYSRLQVERLSSNGLRSMDEPKAGRVTAVFEQGVVVADPDTGMLVWDSPTGHPAPGILSELAATPDGSPVLLPVAGESDHAVAVINGRLVLVEI